jgi:hypothetical protein
MGRARCGPCWKRFPGHSCLKLNTYCSSCIFIGRGRLFPALSGAEGCLRLGWRDEKARMGSARLKPFFFFRLIQISISEQNSKRNKIQNRTN